jgi:cystathionine beta-lyase
VALCDLLEREASVRFSDGLEYGECGRYFIRINLATSRENVELGLSRLKAGIEKIIKNRK